MPSTLRTPELDERKEGTVTAPTNSRMLRLKKLICGGPWAARDDIVLIYWRPDSNYHDGGYWVAWIDKAPKVDPLPEAQVNIA